jgi:hypothetical protein
MTKTNYGAWNKSYQLAQEVHKLVMQNPNLIPHSNDSEIYGYGKLGYYTGSPESYAKHIMQNIAGKITGEAKVEKVEELLSKWKQHLTSQIIKPDEHKWDHAYGLAKAIVDDPNAEPEKKASAYKTMDNIMTGSYDKANISPDEIEHSLKIKPATGDDIPYHVAKAMEKHKTTSTVNPDWDPTQFTKAHQLAQDILNNKNVGALKHDHAQTFMAYYNSKKIKNPANWEQLLTTGVAPAA